MSPPNILLVMADDHRADAIGALGHPAVSTPHLDDLVRRGTTLTRINTAGGLMAAVCSPSRASLLTGLFPFRADAAPRLIRNPPYEVRIPSLARTLPQHFRFAGYETFFTGKWHNDLPALLRSFERGRQIFHGGMCDHEHVPVRDLEEIRRGAPEHSGPGFSTDLFCGAAEEFIRSRARDRPFLAWVALTSPHDPRTPPDEYRKHYDPASLPLPPNFQTEHAFDNGELAIRDECLIERPLSPDQVRSHLADYYGMISHHDAGIGRLMRALKETGQDANTLIVYLSDHGLALGSHGLLGKQNLYEHSVRVPLILCGPGIPGGARHDGLGYAFDLYATLCELTGVPVPGGLDSRSLVPGWASGATAVRTTLGAAYMAGQRMVTDGRWKLVVYRVGKTERIQLFDLTRDPHECHNLAAGPQQAKRIEHLWGQLRAWQTDAGDRWLRETQPAGDLSGQTA
ncbi:MAG: sulfatase-like hydrolase/transferase [Opitutaceae bacterium]|nr:sulfatase-like hydrolase/transferase [Opitutaceae bacterium]